MLFGDRTPSSLRGNLFLAEFKFLSNPLNSSVQKYNILYTVLAPKLMMRKGLVNSQLQRDAYQVIKALSEHE